MRVNLTRSYISKDQQSQSLRVNQSYQIPGCIWSEYQLDDFVRPSSPIRFYLALASVEGLSSIHTHSLDFTQSHEDETGNHGVESLNSFITKVLSKAADKSSIIARRITDINKFSKTSRLRRGSWFGVGDHQWITEFRSSSFKRPITRSAKSISTRLGSRFQTQS